MKDTWLVVDRLADIIISHNRSKHHYKREWKPLGCIVEIGMGESTNILGEHAKKCRANHYSCDIDPKLASRPWHAKHIVFCGISLEFINKYEKIWQKDKPVLVFIDGQHSYNVVLGETNFFLKVLVDTGMIFLHDTYPHSEKYVTDDGRRSGNVYKLRQQLEKRSDLELFTWTYTAKNLGLTMIQKKAKSREYFQL